jgi:hypothetical protein
MTATYALLMDAVELKGKIGFEPGELHVLLSGCADSRVMAPLKELVTKVHDEMLRTGTPEAVVDFRELEFMNSSCFKAFVSWISQVQDLDPQTRYRIRFLSDRAKPWQRRSLAALSCFAADIIHVEA